MTITTSDSDDSICIKDSSPKCTLKRLQWTYLIGNFLMAAANHLPGAYRYAIYQSYGINRATIELFYVIYYGSALFLGTFVASLSDQIGRRFACVLFGVFYILYCFSFRFPYTNILALGTIPWGIASAIDQTVFEAWLITEHRKLSRDPVSLKYILRNTSLVKICASIGVALASQFLVQSFGYLAPFNAAILCLFVMMTFISCTWSENHGNKHMSSMTSLTLGFHALRDDYRIVLLGLCTSFYEATSYIYGIEWTPALQNAKSMIIYDPIPLGFCFAGQLLSRFIGTLAFGILARHFRTESFMIVIFFLAAFGLSVPIFFPDAQWPIMIGFCLYEFSFGVYRPASGLLRSEYIPDDIRATVMNYLRVPQLVLVLGILLSHFQLSVVFFLWVFMSSLAMICMTLLNFVTLPSEKVPVIQHKDVLGYEPIVQSENTILQIDVDSSGETSDGH
ncbi:unnamed protein product [Adineta ricciae]|uniref:Uncharacterized protein n=1 Tax=Adineta ricciae TaxID=249248 RepID=A0A814QF59_ADIRI|nr:unnamed protein product [Adineta ricciae]CAF1419425.1 unnamed protein product [Adineta ricciae]